MLSNKQIQYATHSISRPAKQTKGATDSILVATVYITGNAVIQGISHQPTQNQCVQYTGSQPSMLKYHKLAPDVGASRVEQGWAQAQTSNIPAPNAMPHGGCKSDPSCLAKRTTTSFRYHVRTKVHHSNFRSAIIHIIHIYTNLNRSPTQAPETLHKSQ